MLRRGWVVTLWVFFGCGESSEPAIDAGVDTGQVNESPDAELPDAAADALASDDASTGWRSASDEQADAMHESLQRAVAELGLEGAAFAVANRGDGTLWSDATGYANRETEAPWTPEGRIRIGSVTKTFTAALIFLLVEEGVLSLDDDLEQWVPGYFDELGIEVRHLLSNTSGIVSYNYVGSFDQNRTWTPTELVDWAVLHESALRFAPGAQWEYSNTNFVLLGLIVEAATSRTYEEVLTSRILEPLGLRDTYLADGTEDDPLLVECYDADGTNISRTFNPTFGWAAGAIVSTPSDLARWGAALFGGDILEASSITQMTTLTVLNSGETVPDYGLGAFVEADAENAIYGHTGGIGGFLTYLYYWRNDGIALVASSNTFGTDLRELAGYGWSVPLDL